MSVGSDPIECCVRGRFLCVCVTARRRGFRGGLLRRGSEKLLSTCFARLSGIGFAAGGGSARASFSRCAAHFGSCRLFAVGLLRRGSEKLLSTCFARLSGIGFAAGGGSARASFSRCAAHFGSCRLFAVGLLRRGSEKLLSTCFARLSGIGFAAGGGSARASFSRCAAHFGSCRLFAVGLLRRGSEKLLSTCFTRLPGIGFAAGGDRRGLPLPVRCAFRFAARAGSSPPGLLPTTDDGRTSFVPHLGRGGGRRAALLPLFTLRRQGSLLEVFSFRQASDESADRIRQVENALHVAALSGRAAAFGGTRGRRGRTVSLDTGEIMSDEREGADAGKRAGARSGPCPQAVAADESPGVGNSAMGGKVKRRRRKPPAFRKKVTPIGLKPITF